VVASCLAAALGLAYLGATLGGGKCDFTWNFGWVRCLAEFWIGLCLFQAHRYADGRFSARARTLWTIAAIAAFSIYIRFGDINAWIVPVAALVVFATSLESSLVRRVFANRVSHRIGEISFSMYMLHVPLGMSLMRATMQFPRLYQNTVSSIATVTSVVIILLIASSLTYDYFEMPMKRWLSRKPKTQSLVFDQVQTKLAS
jgi:peptidoglycan/LPS O-acetylase OafA/YrhL